MFQQIMPALRMMTLLTVVTGVLYPGVITGLCQVLLKHQANGSLVKSKGQVVGSLLLGQNFTKPEYFHSRPSAAGAEGYDASASSGSNLGPTSQKLYDRVKSSADQFHKENPAFTGMIPADALTASASGLDPDISLANAEIQAVRVAQSRGIELVAIQKMIHVETQDRTWGLLGESRVNVLRLNLALDQQFSKK